MTLYQLLRYVINTTPIALYDIKGQLINKYKSKMEIDSKLLDYDVFRLNTLQVTEFNTTSCYLCIMLEK